MNLKNGIVVTVSIHYTYLKLYQICKNFELFSNQFFATIKSVGGGGRDHAIFTLYLEYFVRIKIQ